MQKATAIPHSKIAVALLILVLDSYLLIPLPLMFHQLAEAINISPTHMKHIESEHRKPSVEVLFLLADVLNFSMDAMLMETQSTEHAKRVNEMNLMMNKCTDEELDVFIAALRELMKHKR